MNNKLRGFLFVFLFFCLANAVFGQQNVNLTKHRLPWTRDDYALQYEVIIEKEENGRYRSVLREFTEEPYIDFSLPPGDYRLRVIPYDFRNMPGEGTDWKLFKILAAVTPDAESQLVVEEPPPPPPEPAEEAIPVAEEETEDEKTAPPDKNRDIYIGLFLEGIGYSYNGVAFGGGATIGGSFSSKGFGISLLYAQDADKLITLEVLGHFRLYSNRIISSFHLKNNTGPFMQAEIGLASFAYEKFEKITDYYSLSVGVCLGYRFPLGKLWYLEPCIRGGFPYIFGASLTGGIKFNF